MTTPEPWYDAAFRARYLQVYAHRDEDSARTEVAFVARLFDASAGPLLDAGCGAGRHARALTEVGFRVLGIDRSMDLLLAAGRPVTPSGDWLHYARADFRALPIRSHSLGSVASLFTAFGYFEDDENRGQLQEFRRCLRDDGGLLLDFLNADRVRDTLVPRSERVVGDVRVVEERAIRAGRVEKDVTFLDAATGRRLEGWRESVRLYDREQLEHLLQATGFAVRGVYGDLAGVAWNKTSPRCVLWAATP